MSDDTARPTLTLEVAYLLDDKPHKLEALLESITLSNGKQIPTKHFRLRFGKVGTGPRLKRLQELGMPMDLNRWLLVVDGEGIGQPDFTFHFLGVVTQSDVSRPDAQSPMPFILDLWDQSTKKTVARFPLGFMWERVVLLKNSHAVLAELYDPNRKYEKTSQTNWALGIMNLASNALTVKGRADTIRKLARGYELMVDLWEAVSKQQQTGRRPAVDLDSNTIPRWSGEYEAAHAALKKELAKRRSKWLSKYTESDRKTIIKRCLNDPPREIKDSLARFTSISDVALQYTAWRCSQIAIGTWQRDRLRDVLQESDRFNGIDRRHSRN